MNATANNLSITRLFSTGRFEHQKISISISPGPGAKAGALLRELDAIMEDLNPCCPVDSYDFGEAKRIVLMTPNTVLAEKEADPDFQHRVDCANITLAKYEEWKLRRSSAFDRLDAMGAVAEIEEK